jgi:CheY-like chemotaxis protein
MPDLDGFEATRRIRARASATSHPRMPIVALTAHAFNGNSEMWRAAGMDDYIVKPFKLSGLADYLTRWIEPVSNADETLPTQSQSADAAPMGDMDILDTAVLDELRAMSGPSGSMLTRVIALYDEHAPVALAKLAAAITGGMQGEVAAQAHALKSLSLNAGAKRAAVLCEALEEASRNGDLSGAASHQLTIAAAIDEAIGALTAYDRADLRSVAA